MSNAESIIRHLKTGGDSLCDDCLSTVLNIQPRQQVNMLCHQMAGVGTVSRAQGVCSRCKRGKIVNAASGVAACSTTPSLFIVDPPRDLGALPAQQASGTEFPCVPSPRTSTPTMQRQGDGAPVAPAEFEARVGAYLERTLGQHFGSRILPLGHGQGHAVDQVSADGTILVECKSYTWTSGGNMPSGKIAALREAVFLLKSCPGERRILAMHNRPFPGRELLVNLFCRLNQGLLGDVEVWDFIIGDRPENDRVRVVAGGLP